jgi:hypothetical protein
VAHRERAEGPDALRRRQEANRSQVRRRDHQTRRGRDLSDANSIISAFQNTWDGKAIVLDGSRQHDPAWPFMAASAVDRIGKLTLD